MSYPRENLIGALLITVRTLEEEGRGKSAFCEGLRELLIALQRGEFISLT